MCSYDVQPRRKLGFARASAAAVALALIGCVHAPTGPTAPAASSTTDLAALVDPLVGTADEGKGFPGAALPFGMMQWSPDSADVESGYRYVARAVAGFSLNHLNGAGCTALGDFPFIPTTLPIDGAAAEPERHQSGIDHAAERATPGSYEVTLGSGVRVRLAVTARAGLGEFRFPASPHAGLLVLAGKLTRSRSVQVGEAEVHTVGDRRLEGSLVSRNFCGMASMYRVHIAAELDRPFDRAGAWPRTEQSPGGTFVQLDTRANPVVKVKVALSYVSVANAWANLRAEATTWDVDAVARSARAVWNQRLGQVAIDGGSAAQRRTFYTALYHAFLHPNVATDASGEYMGFDRRVHRSARPVYTNNTAWT
jgi:predicted alpha-1,2-mannosidase